MHKVTESAAILRRFLLFVGEGTELLLHSLRHGGTALMCIVVKLWMPSYKFTDSLRDSLAMRGELFGRK